MEETQKLKSKDECERQLAVELAVGAIDSIDSLIEKGHEVACEYACQLLFDNLRKKVAEHEDLPIRIVNHLLGDRCNDIRLAVIQSNWKVLTLEQQEEVIVEAEYHFDKLPNEEKEKYRSRYSSYKGKSVQLKQIIEPLLITALEERDEPKALRYINILGIRNRLPTEDYHYHNDIEFIQTLKDMPKVFNVYWNSVDKYYRKVNVILAHPDEKLRMEEVQRILKKETRVSDLRDWQEVVEKANRRENLKGSILKCWVVDPSEKIRKFIAKTTTNVDVLEMLSTGESNVVSKIAYPRYKKFRKRAEYSKAYQERKKEKLRLEEAKRRREHGW